MIGVRKVYLHRTAQYIAINLKSLAAWEFVPLTVKGRVFKTHKTVIGYESTFKSAITTVRKNGDKIPASGWELHRIDKSLHKRIEDIAPYVWDRKPDSVDLNPTKEALQYLVQENPFREKVSDDKFKKVLIDYGKKQGKEYLQAMAGFVVWCRNEGNDHYPDKEMRTTLVHDLKGANKEDKRFVPRTSGYLEQWEEYLESKSSRE